MTTQVPFRWIGSGLLTLLSAFVSLLTRQLLWHYQHGIKALDTFERRAKVYHSILAKMVHPGRIDHISAKPTGRDRLGLWESVGMGRLGATR